MLTIGILSDTHIQTVDETFLSQCNHAFADCDMIIHAGDLIDVSILGVFRGKEIHAVCGNMCNRSTKLVLPETKQLVLAGFAITITHGTGPRHNIEERVIDQFPVADCIIFGHTHQAVCQTFGKTLLINPGSFMGTGRYGAAGTYALLTIDKHGLNASIHRLENQL